MKTQKRREYVKVLEAYLPLKNCRGTNYLYHKDFFSRTRKTYHLVMTVFFYIILVYYNIKTKRQ